MLLDVGHGLLIHVGSNRRGDVLLIGIQAHVVADDGNLVAHGRIVVGADAELLVALQIIDKFRLGAGLFIQAGLLVLAQVVGLGVAEDIGPEPKLGRLGCGRKGIGSVRIHGNAEIVVNLIAAALYIRNDFIELCIQGLVLFFGIVVDSAVFNRHLVGKTVVGQKNPVPVIDISPGGRQLFGLFRQEVVIGLIVFSPHNLQYKETGHQDEGKEGKEENNDPGPRREKFFFQEIEKIRQSSLYSFGPSFPASCRSGEGEHTG